MARTAMALGHEYMVLTDHSARLTIAHGLNRERLLTQLDEVAALNERLAPFRILTGMEVDIFEDGSLDLDEDLLERLDVVVGSVHSKFRLARAEMTRRLVLALASPHVDILGHMHQPQGASTAPAPAATSTPTSCSPPPPASTRPSRSTAGPSARTRPTSCWSPRSTGAARSPSTPTPTPPASSNGRPTAARRPPQCGVPIESIVNTWSADELLAWAGSHPTE